MNVLGLDLSLTSTGVAMPDGDTFTVHTDDKDPLEERLAVILDTIVRRIEVAAINDRIFGFGIDLAVVEDLPRNARGAGATGPVHGAVRYLLWQQGVPIAKPTAATIKKYATGVGNCSKDAMGIAAMKRANLDFSGRADECDAWWLRAAALDAYGLPVVEMPKAQRDALAKVDWPVLNPALGGVA